jgi:hypothetical protein
MSDLLFWRVPRSGVAVGDEMKAGGLLWMVRRNPSVDKRRRARE